MRVLIIDDDRDTVDSMASLLEILHCEVRAAYDPFTGLEEATTFQPALLLADLAMPVLSGVELARRVRQCRALDQTVLAAVTGYSDDTYRRAAKEAGFDEYLVKPIAFDLLMELLARVEQRIADSRRLVEQANRIVIEAKKRGKRSSNEYPFGGGW